MHGNLEQARLLTDSIELFRSVEGLDPVAISQLCRWQRYPKRSQILSNDDPSTDVFFIVEGAVLARSYSLEGKEVSYNDIRKGEIFGEFSAIDGKPRSASVDAIEDCTIARMTSEQFRSLLTENPIIGLRLAEMLVAKSRALTRRIFEYGTLPVRERVQQELLRLCSDAKPGVNRFVIDPAPTHYEIATRIATHREAVSRELNQLAFAGLIEIDRRRIKILDIKKLRDLNSGS